MNELVFTLSRFSFLLLLWVFIFLIIRILRRDVAENTLSNAVRTRKSKPHTASRFSSEHPRRQATRLVITQGPLAGSTVPLSPTSLTIGRSPACALVLEDSYTSSRHARIFPKDGTWWLEDLGSTNGTTLADQPVTTTVELPINTPVRIGQTTLELRP